MKYKNMIKMIFCFFLKIILALVNIEKTIKNVTILYKI